MTLTSLSTLPMAHGPAVLDLMPAIEQSLSGGQLAHIQPPDTAPRTTDVRLPTAWAGGLAIDTTGSTGGARTVLLPTAALAASAHATHQRLGGPGDWLLALPTWHIAGLQVLLRAQLTGRHVTVLDSSVPFTAAGFVETSKPMPFSRRYVSLVPTQLHRLLADARAAAELATFAAVLVGGAATSPQLLERARDAGVRVVTTYGMTETSGGCVYDGRPLDGVQVHSEDGRLVITGPVVAAGYLGADNGADSSGAFPGGQRFVTGDLGTVDDRGRVEVLGRADDVIISGGLNIAPQPIERALSTIPGVDDVVVTSVPDAEWGSAVTALFSGPAPGVDQLDAALSVLPAAWRPKILLAHVSIPLAGIGKPDRRAAAALAAELHRPKPPGNLG